MKSPPQPTESNWTPEQAARVAEAMAVQKAGRRSFLRHGALTTAALAGGLLLAPRDARAQGSGY